ncbi:sugar dehydratase, partial [Bacillus sp. LR--39]
IKHQYLSAEKARKLLNWTPAYTIDEGLEKTIEWYTEFFKK